MTWRRCIVALTGCAGARGCHRGPNSISWGGHLNAFAVGNRKYLGAITGMLRALTMRELLAVLAHEVSHIANNDIWGMQLADTISRFA